MTTLRHNLLVLIVLVCTSCQRPEPKLSPGSARTDRQGTNLTQTVTQSEDPASETRQTHTIVTETVHFPTNFALLSTPSNGVVRSRTEETTETIIGPAQDNTETRSIWAKGKAKAEEVKAFMNSVKWLPLLGLLPLGLLVFSFTPYGRPMGLSKEGRLILGAAAGACVIAPAMSKAVVDNAMWFALLVFIGVAGWYILERKNRYKEEAALRTPVPKE